MTLTKEQANKIKVARDTEVGDLCSYEGAHHKICAENLAKWAYRRLESWPDFLEGCKNALWRLDPQHNSGHGTLRMDELVPFLKRIIDNAEKNID